MYAIVKTGGKQYRVERGQSLLVERLPVEDGGEATLQPLLYVDGDNVVDGEGLAKVSVQARVLGHERGPKLRVVKFKPKRGYRRRTGHRQELTRIEVTEIKLSERRPAARRPPKPVAAEVPEVKAVTEPAPTEVAATVAEPEKPARSRVKKPAAEGAEARPPRRRTSAAADEGAARPEEARPARRRASAAPDKGAEAAAKPEEARPARRRTSAAAGEGAEGAPKPARPRRKPTASEPQTEEGNGA